MWKNSLKFSALLLSSVVLFSGFLSANDADENLGEVENTPMQRVPGIGRFAVPLKQLCGHLAKDGRRELFYELAKFNADAKLATCPACKDFYRLLERGCSDQSDQKVKKPRRSKKKDEVSSAATTEEIPLASPTPVAFKQRYPHINVSLAVQNIVTEWAKDAYVQGYYEISQHFVGQLDQFAKTRAASDYADIITTTWMNILGEHQKKVAKSTKSVKLDATKPISNERLDELFAD